MAKKAFDLSTQEGREEAAQKASQDKDVLEQIVEGLSGSSRTERQRAATTCVLIAVNDPDVLKPYADDIAERVCAFLDQFDSPKGYIPCVIQGGPGSVYPGVYEAIFDTIEEYNQKRFGVTKEECDLHLPLQFEAKGYA